MQLIVQVFVVFFNRCVCFAFDLRHSRAKLVCDRDNALQIQCDLHFGVDNTVINIVILIM